MKAAAGTLAVVLAAAVGGGCGGGPKPSAGGAGEAGPEPTSPPPVALPADQPLRPACGLVTQAEVEAAVGSRLGPGQQENQEPRSVCTFGLAASADQRVALVVTSSSGVPAAFEAARGNMGSPQTVSAGDQAFASGGLAIVRKGTTMVAIVVALRRQDSARLTAVASKLAQSVGSHL